MAAVQDDDEAHEVMLALGSATGAQALDEQSMVALLVDSGIFSLRWGWGVTCFFVFWMASI